MQKKSIYRAVAEWRIRTAPSCLHLHQIYVRIGAQGDALNGVQIGQLKNPASIWKRKLLVCYTADSLVAPYLYHKPKMAHI